MKPSSSTSTFYKLNTERRSLIIVIHLFDKDPKDFISLIKELYGKINCYRVKNKRITIVIDSNDIEPLENIDSFLQMKYPYYQGYLIASSTYKAANDYTGLDRESMIVVEPYYRY